MRERLVDKKRNLKTPVKTRTLHLSEPYGVRDWSRLVSIEKGDILFVMTVGSSI
jgi:hypothetical protein